MADVTITISGWLYYFSWVVILPMLLWLAGAVLSVIVGHFMFRKHHPLSNYTFPCGKRTDPLLSDKTPDKILILIIPLMSFYGIFLFIRSYFHRRRCLECLVKSVK